MSRLAVLALCSCLAFPVDPAACAGGSPESLLPPPGQDWVVRTPLLLTDLTLTLRGDLIIRRPGALMLRGVTLRMEGAHDGERRIVVEGGGRLSARPSPLTLRRTLITRGHGGGRFSFDVSPGASLELVSAVIEGAGWDGNHPGLVADRAELAAIVDSDFVDSFDGLTLRNVSADIIASRFDSNRHAGLVVENGTVRLTSGALRGQRAGLIGSDSEVAIESTLFSGNDLGLRVRGGRAELASSLFHDNGGHAVIEGSASVSLHDNVFIVASGDALVVQERSTASLRFNDFLFNTFGVRNLNPGAMPIIDAAQNYWGAENGPGGAVGGDGDPVSDGVSVIPWCTTTCRRAPSSSAAARR